MDRLEELVHVSIGRASMCWSEMPKGVFNDQMASQIAQDLIAAIKEHEQSAIAEERAAWCLSHPHIIRDASGQEIARTRSL